MSPVSAYEGGEVIDRDDGASFPDALRIDLDGWFGEGSVDIVNRDRIVRVGGASCQL